MRKNSAQSLVEAACGLVVVYAIAIAIVDVAMAIYAIAVNDSVCRNAATFAAAGKPSEAEDRVRAVIEQSGNGFGKLVSAPILVPPLDIKISSKPEDRRDPDRDEVINPGGVVIGTVRVKTQIEVRPFAVDLLLKQFQVLTFESSHSFPIHYVMPSTINHNLSDLPIEKLYAYRND